jgi:hypothetical protein
MSPHKGRLAHIYALSSEKGFLNVISAISVLKHRESSVRQHLQKQFLFAAHSLFYPNSFGDPIDFSYDVDMQDGTPHQQTGKATSLRNIVHNPYSYTNFNG